MNMRMSSLVAALALPAALSAPAGAQIRGSEAAVVAQTIDGTTITIEYSRPRAAGRELFGKLVAWDQPWTGANWATTLEADRPIRLNGTEVPAGEYSVWWIPAATGEWTLMLDPDARLFHFQKPGPREGQIRIATTPTQAPHAENLTWSFPAVAGDAATLQMRWGTTAVPVQVVVQPTKPIALAAEDRAPFTGSYAMKFVEGLGWPATGTLEIFAAGETLRGRMPFPIHPDDELEFDLVPAGRNRFSPGLYRDGKLFNVEMGATFEFDVEAERATVVRLRGIEGTVFAEGRRAGG